MVALFLVLYSLAYWSAVLAWCWVSGPPCPGLIPLSGWLYVTVTPVLVRRVQHAGSATRPR